MGFGLANCPSYGTSTSTLTLWTRLEDIKSLNALISWACYTLKKLELFIETPSDVGESKFKYPLSNVKLNSVLVELITGIDNLSSCLALKTLHIQVDAIYGRGSPQISECISIVNASLPLPDLDFKVKIYYLTFIEPTSLRIGLSKIHHSQHKYIEFLLGGSRYSAEQLSAF